MSEPAHHIFETPEQLHAWLRVNHASATELWVRIFKKATGLATVTWDECVVAAICWGWIDGLRNALDDTSFLQRLIPFPDQYEIRREAADSGLPRQGEATTYSD
ncbi:MAG: YdeI/OmpD-associated family protein [Giesbergeria sp.]